MSLSIVGVLCPCCRVEIISWLTPNFLTFQPSSNGLYLGYVSSCCYVGVITCRYMGSVQSERCNLSPKQTGENTDYSISGEQRGVVQTSSENSSNFSHGAEMRLLGVR